MTTQLSLKSIAIRPRQAAVIRHAKERYPDLSPSDLAKITGTRPEYVRAALSRAKAR